MLLCFTLALPLLISPGYAAKAQEKGVMTPMKYEGGSLPLNQHDKLETWVNKDEVILVQGKQRFVIPVKSINEVSYGNDVHRRVGAAVGVALVTFGIGALMLLVKTKKHYVGIVWSDKPVATATGTATTSSPAPSANAASPSAAAPHEPSAEGAKGGVVFKVGKGDYRGFMTALEGVTGVKAINTDATGPGGTSK